MQDARDIGYGATLGEGSLALAATVAAIAGMGFVDTQCLPWSCDFTLAKKGALPTFIDGSAALLQQIYISENIAKTLIVVLVVSFAATTLDSATRIQRYIITEFGEAAGINILKNKLVSTFFAVIPAYLIATNDQLRNNLWTTFGASNQMLAALTLMILSIYFYKKNKNIIPFVIPMLIVTAIAVSALFIKFNSSASPLISIINGFLLCLIFWMVIEGAIHIFKHLKTSE